MIRLAGRSHGRSGIVSVEVKNLRSRRSRPPDGHHSLVQYRLPTTGELIPLLQIAPSKTDKERLLVVSPELADVLAQIISRVRGSLGAVPLVSAYADCERVWLPPSPRPVQRRINAENRAFAHSSILKMLTAAVTRAGRVDPVEGHALHYSPHDFRHILSAL